MPKQKKDSVDSEVLEQKTDDKSIVAQSNQIVNYSTEALIARAIDQKVDVGTMERLLAMAKDMQAIKAKQEFDKAMANFQADCPAIKKDKEVIVNGKVAYRYAPIDSIVSQVKGILQENGFSYSTNMELLENGVKVFVKVTHVLGHSEVTEMNVPLGVKTGIMSASQQVAAAQTFAKRYAFLNAFGIMTGDEDNDGAEVEKIPLKGANEYPTQQPLATPPTYSPPVDYYTSFAAKIDEADTEASLNLVGSEIANAFQNHKLSPRDYSFLKSSGLKKREELTSKVS